jgi:hypothetical protein
MVSPLVYMSFKGLFVSMKLFVSDEVNTIARACYSCY